VLLWEGGEVNELNWEGTAARGSDVSLFPSLPVVLQLLRVRLRASSHIRDAKWPAKLLLAPSAISGCAYYARTRKARVSNVSSTL
jgi:hypothetical protein